MKRVVRRILHTVVLIGVLFFALLIVFRIKYSNTIFTLAQTQVSNITSDLINDAIDRQIDSGNMRYDRIVYFEKNLNGQITALKTNMSEVNRLKTEVLNLINDEILELDSSRLGIPAGDLFLPELFSGRGPEIPVHILSIRNSDAEFLSDFVEAGINQTLHKLNMHVSVDVSLLVLGKISNYTITSQVVVAETIIVGQVPDTYLQTGGQYGSQRENSLFNGSTE